MVFIYGSSRNVPSTLDSKGNFYAIKLWIFCSQFPLTKKEEKGLRDAAVFVVHVYLKAWFTAPLPTSAPRNDLNLLKSLHTYKTVIPSVAAVAIQRICLDTLVPCGATSGSCII